MPHQIIKSPKNYECEICLFKCSKKCDWDRHIITQKHKNRTTLNSLEQEKHNDIYHCKNCNKEYKARNSLWYHEKKCKNINEYNNYNNYIENNNSNDENKIINPHKEDIKALTDLVLELVKSNTELQQQMLDVCKNSNTTINNNNNNSKTFNMQVFLNEKCKDAMNIMDFVNSLQLQLSDLEKMGEVGYVNGISSLIVKQLKSLDVTQRPIHCSDVKRETLYIKDEDKWEKDHDKVKIDNMIKKVTDKNYFKLRDWKIANPGYDDAFSKKSDDYGHIMIGSFDGTKENRVKVIKNIAKEVKIDKS